MTLVQNRQRRLSGSDRRLPIFSLRIIGAFFFTIASLDLGAEMIRLPPIDLVVDGSRTESYSPRKFQTAEPPLAFGSLPSLGVDPSSMQLNWIDLPNIPAGSLQSDGSPGALVQAGGFVPSAENISVRWQGIPLSLPQGGGADLGALPKLWFQSVEFSPATIWGIYDPRAAGFVANVLSHSDQKQVASISLQSPGTVSFNGAANNEELRAFIGTSMGEFRRLSAAVEYEDSAKRSRVHRQRTGILVLQQSAPNNGTEKFPTPGFEQGTSRILPKYSLFSRWNERVRSELTLIGDYSRFQISPPTRESADRYLSETISGHIHQSLEFEFASDWSIRGDAGWIVTEYDQLSIRDAAKSDQFGYGAMALRHGDDAESQTLGIRWVHPGWGTSGLEGQFLLHQKTQSGFVIQANIASIEHSPSLIDRYYEFIDFEGNQRLLPERRQLGSLSLATPLWLGMEHSLSFLTQRIERPFLYEFHGVVNAQDYSLASLLTQSRVQLWAHSSLSLATTWNFLDRAQGWIPGLRPFQWRITLQSDPVRPVRGWVGIRAGHDLGVANQGRDYAVGDVGVDWQITRPVRLAVSIQNMLNHPVEIRPGLIDGGRAVAIELAGRW